MLGARSLAGVLLERPFSAHHIPFTRGPSRVELSASIKASLPGRYASALFDLASEAGNVTAVEADLERLAQALAESNELRALIRNPEVSRAALGRVFAGLAKPLKLDKLTGNFLGVLAGNRRAGELPAVIRAFQAIAAAQRGEVTAEVMTAHPLTADQLGALEHKLRAREGRTVKVRTSVDPELLGGIVVTIGSQRLDNSIRTRLNTLAQAMKG
jgi:F-type H+-transporting ATPase subunit delta